MSELPPTSATPTTPPEEPEKVLPCRHVGCRATFRGRWSEKNRKHHERTLQHRCPPLCDACDIYAKSLPKPAHNFNCRYCNREFNKGFNMRRHEQSCRVRNLPVHTQGQQTSAPFGSKIVSVKPSATRKPTTSFETRATPLENSPSPKSSSQPIVPNFSSTCGPASSRTQAKPFSLFESDQGLASSLLLPNTENNNKTDNEEQRPSSSSLPQLPPLFNVPSFTASRLGLSPPLTLPSLVSPSLDNPPPFLPHITNLFLQGTPDLVTRRELDSYAIEALRRLYGRDEISEVLLRLIRITSLARVSTHDVSPPFAFLPALSATPNSTKLSLPFLELPLAQYFQALQITAPVQQQPLPQQAMIHLSTQLQHLQILQLQQLQQLHLQQNQIDHLQQKQGQRPHPNLFESTTNPATTIPVTTEHCAEDCSVD